MIVLADRKAIYHLLDKKGSIYSERPNLAVPTFMSRGCHMTFEQATPEWREKRSVITRNLNPQNLDKKHFRVQEAESILFMNNLVHHPNKAFDYARLYASSVAAILVWGFRAKDFDSFFYKDFYNFVDQWLDAIEPGANPPVEQLPWLWYLPGAWKKRAYHVRSLMDTTWSKARQMVEDRRGRGDVRDSMIDLKLAEYEKIGWPMSQYSFNNLGGEMLEAGADTTANMLLTIILAVTKFPEVQIKARKELDEVCGTERTPLFSDFDRLPYINCIIKEALRWRPTSDLGIPHRLAKDDWYEGMLFPKDSTVWLAAWAIHQNDEEYPDHDRFNPDRFKNHTKLANDYAVGPDWQNRDKFFLSLHHYGYGAGRRMCPGIHLAERSMWRVTAKLLWAFEFEELPDRPIDVNAYTSSNLVRPLEYEVKVTPRSKQHEKVIKTELTGALDFLGQYD
ncbi:hypothetical protein LTR07_010027 [Exophiala xenobiotica]|nr:hypothetical protein LTR40_005781 [Exophiala xenobiotica]KAK5331454.1 hypothetical protein LTR93_000457 [Exophiala xenobiotica]KAK5408245.1 hypothetical protein LTR90_009701 [Exophiala xenobiotica]KAK5504450.1 hypothetical protein LTR21_010587 [Exophiala xenobiotica]KAK5510245.1 hypothetical protein LTR07_010027 [Exophiala xenobiotica]